MQVQMKQMLFASIGIHLFFITCLLMFHYLKWNHPLIKPKVLSVQWVTLPQPHPEIMKPASLEPTKKIESAPTSKPPKKSAPPPQPHFKPVPKSQVSFPLPVPPKRTETSSLPQPVLPKAESLSSPQAEAKKEEIPVPAEPQKIEIAPISEIDPTYVERVKRTVDMNWNPPQFSGQPKEVTISFEVLKNGIVRNPKIVKSSKDSYFDMAALRAVFDSRRFGQLPPDYPSLSVEITCTFSQNKGS
jgi:TonB family protein